MKLLWNISFTNKLLIILFWTAAFPLAIFAGFDVLLLLLGVYGRVYSVVHEHSYLGYCTVG